MLSKLLKKRILFVTVVRQLEKIVKIWSEVERRVPNTKLYVMVVEDYIMIIMI